MNKFLSLLAFGAFLFFGTASAEAPQWVEYQPAGIGFRVELPGKPDIENEPAKPGGNQIKTVVASVSPSGEVAYLAMYTQYAAGSLNSDPQKSLDGAVRGLAGQGTVRSQRRLTVGTAPARYAIVDMKDNQVGIDLMTMSGNFLIQIICVVPKGQEETSPVVDRIVKSFALVAR